MNILEQVQNFVSTVFCLHKDNAECNRLAQISNQFDKKCQSIEDAHPLDREHNTTEEIDKDKDNFLRGSLMNNTRRRHSKTMNKIAISYWRHGSGCSCCKESHKSEDFQQIAPTSIFNKGMLPELSRSGYIDLTDPGMGTELQCLTSFITESGRHQVLTQAFVDETTAPPLSTSSPIEADTITKLTAQVRQIEESLTELAMEAAVATGDVIPVQVDVQEEEVQEPHTRRCEPTLQNLPACNNEEFGTTVEITEGASSLLGRLILK